MSKGLQESKLYTTSLNFEASAEKTLPDTIDILPPDTKIVGMDKRTFFNPGNSQLIKEFNSRNLQLAIDVNHSTELKAPKGESSPAQGWVTELFEEDKKLRGKVSWNRDAENEVGGGKYRYISPVLRHDNKGNIRRIKSVGLVNQPNFNELDALNNESSTDSDEGGEMKKIAKALGLPEDASEDQVLTAVNSLQDKAEKTSLNMEDYVPREDYKIALNRANEAETELKKSKDEEFSTALNAELDKAIEGRKIAPASRSFYEDTIKDDKGLKSFKKMIDGSAEIVSANTEVPDGAPGDGEKTSLNAEEKEIAEQLGLTDEEALEAYGKGE